MVKPVKVEKRVRYMRPKTTPESKGLEFDTRLRVSDMVISDEFVLAENWDTGKVLAEKLLFNPGYALLIRKGDKVVGVVNEYNLLRAIAEGKIEVNLKAEDLMTTEILEVKETDALEDILPILYEKRPYAVIVTDDKGRFKGYFSPKDCELASVRLKLYD